MQAEGIVVSEPSAAMNSLQQHSSEGRSSHLSSPQSLNHTSSAVSIGEVHHGGNDAPTYDHRYPDANPLKGRLLDGVHIRRPDTIVTEARPPISQRTASLPTHRNSVLFSSPSSPSFELEDRFRNQPMQIRGSPEERDAVLCSSGRSAFFSRLTISADIDLDSSSAKSPVPPRPTRSPLRLSPQPDLQINRNANQVDASNLTEAQQGSDGRMNPDQSAVRTRRRTESDATVMTLKAAPTPSTLASPDLSSISSAHYPFHVLRQIHSSMTLSNGALVTQGLCVPRTTWSVTGAKLPALETKNRVMLLLSQSLTVVREAGQPLLQMNRSGKKVLDSAALKAFVVSLEDMEALIGECQKILAKKVGEGKVFVKPRKSNTVRSSLLSRRRSHLTSINWQSGINQ